MYRWESLKYNEKVGDLTKIRLPSAVLIPMTHGESNLAKGFLDSVERATEAQKIRG
jgi:hypothetical protein